jgi:hypothetical protein
MRTKNLTGSNIIMVLFFSLIVNFSNSSCSQGQRTNNEQQNNSRIETCEKAKEIVKERALFYDLGVDVIECQEVSDNMFNVWGAGWKKRNGDRIQFSASVTRDGEVRFRFNRD